MCVKESEKKNWNKKSDLLNCIAYRYIMLFICVNNQEWCN